MPQEQVNDSGERIITGSRRPDGTYRKDVRVRAGYVPQEEQQVYQSRGAMARQGTPRVPGLDDTEVSAAKATTKPKSAKKNEKRKQKKLDSDHGEGAGAVASLAAQLDSTRISEQNGAAMREPRDGSEMTVREKQMRTLRKKLKQAEILVSKQEGGELLTDPEKEKIKKAPSWRAELEELEELG